MFKSITQSIKSLCFGIKRLVMVIVYFAALSFFGWCAVVIYQALAAEDFFMPYVKAVAALV